MTLKNFLLNAGVCCVASALVCAASGAYGFSSLDFFLAAFNFYMWGKQ